MIKGGAPHSAGAQPSSEILSTRRPLPGPAELGLPLVLGSRSQRDRRLTPRSQAGNSVRGDSGASRKGPYPPPVPGRGGGLGSDASC
jgi:hypothetical protein